MTWSPADTARARELLAEATPRPWSMRQYGAPGSDWEVIGPDFQQALATACEHDAALITQAPTLLEAALAEIDRRTGARRERGPERPVEIDREVLPGEHRTKLRDMATLDGGGYGRELADYDRMAIAWALRRIEQLERDLRAVLGDPERQA